jgi:hypothetical protein
VALFETNATDVGAFNILEVYNINISLDESGRSYKRISSIYDIKDALLAKGPIIV